MNLSHSKYNRDKVEGQKLKIQEILNTLDAPSVPLDGIPSVGFCDNVTTQMPNTGVLLSLP